MADEKKKKEPTMADVVQLMSQISADVKGSLASLEERMDKVESSVGPKTATQQIADHVPSQEKKEDEELASAGPAEMNIHPKHRRIVDEILGEQFVAWETYEGTNTTHFLFNIQVPQELSTIPAEDQAKGRELDIRTRAIPNSEGENGVIQWCKLVRKNLNKFYSDNAMPSPFSTAS